jgi:hypothetical protein
MKKYSHKKMRYWGYLIWANISTLLACLVLMSLFYEVPFWKIGVTFLGGYYWACFIYYIAKIKRLE